MSNREAAGGKAVSEVDTRAYIGREPGCGCVTFIAAHDYDTKLLARDVGKLTHAGLSIERVAVDDVYKLPFKFRCPKTGYKHDDKRHEAKLAVSVNNVEVRSRSQIKSGGGET